jgi:hypothetical protein
MTDQSTTNEGVAVQSAFPELAKRCLGCNGAPDFTFQINLSRAGVSTQSQIFGCCVDCSEPGTATYEGLRRRLACLLFMNRNKFHGLRAALPHAVHDSKTAAAGSDE